MNQPRFLSGEYNPQSRQDLIKVSLKDYNTFDEYFHAFIAAIMANPKRLEVDYIPYSRADKELNGEVNASSKLLEFVKQSFTGELFVGGRIHDRNWLSTHTREKVFYRDFFTDYNIALDETEYKSNPQGFNNYFKKVRTNGKVVSQELGNPTIKGITENFPAYRLVLRDDILGGGATIKLALDYLFNNYYYFMGSLQDIIINVDYNEGIHIDSYTYTSPLGVEMKIPIESKHMLLSNKDMIKNNNIKYNKEKQNV